MSQLYRMTPLVTGIRQLSITPASLKAVSEIPKRPATPWASFYAAQVPQYRKSYPNLAVPELMKKISEAWGQVSAAEKEKMKLTYEKEKEIYSQKLKLVPDEVLLSAKSAKVGKKAKSVASDLNKLLAENNKPKRNLSAYLIFCSDIRSQLPANMSPSEKVTHLAKAWKNASEDVKAKYEEKMKAENERYKKELAAWTKKMEKEGIMPRINALQEQVSALKKQAKV